MSPRADVKQIHSIPFQQKGREEEALVPGPEKGPLSGSSCLSQSRQVYEELGEQHGGNRSRKEGTSELGLDRWIRVHQGGHNEKGVPDRGNSVCKDTETKARDARGAFIQ